MIRCDKTMVIRVVCRERERYVEMGGETRE